MKKWIVLFLTLLYVFSLTACSKSGQEQIVEYSFHGEDEHLAVSNGRIVLSDTEEIFDGGDLAVLQAELAADVTAFSTTFYAVISGEQRTILSNSVIDQTGGSIHVNGDLGRVSGDGILIGNKVENIDDLKENLWFELKIVGADGKENVYQLQLELTQIAG